MKDPRTFPCTDSTPDNNGNGIDWTRLEEFYEELEEDLNEDDYNPEDEEDNDDGNIDYLHDSRFL